MLPLGHMGIGSLFVKPWTQKLPSRFLLLGTLLPDIIDKTIYYGMSWSYSTEGEALGLIRGSRTLSHTALFLALLTTFAFIRKSKIFAAIALGVATHILLDNISDTLMDHFMANPIEHTVGEVQPHSALVAMLWPFYRTNFTAAPFHSLSDHFSHSFNPVTIALEVIGGLLLFWSYWQNLHWSELTKKFKPQRRKKSVKSAVAP